MFRRTRPKDPHSAQDARYAHQMGDFYLMAFHTRTPNSPSPIWQMKIMALSINDRCGSRGTAITARELYPHQERHHCPKVATQNLRPLTKCSDRPTHSSNVTLWFPGQSSDSEEGSPSLEPLGIGLTIHGPFASAGDPVTLPWRAWSN
jgi:hypothetical protein